MKTALLRMILLLGAGMSSAHAQQAMPVTLPLEVVSGHLVITLDDQKLGSLRLMVDTGATQTLMGLRAVQGVPVDRHLTDRFFRFNGFGSGSKAKLKGHAVLQLGSGGHDLGKIDALVLNRAQIDSGLQPEVDGILGWDFFAGRCVRIDSKGKQMVVGPAAGCAPTGSGFYSPPVDWTKDGLLLPVTLTLTSGRQLRLNLHVDTGSDSIVLSPRLRDDLQMSSLPQASVNKGSGVNGSFVWDRVLATKIEADGGHPHMEGTIPLTVMRKGSYSQPHWFTDGPILARLLRDGSLGNNMLGYFELIFDGGQKKLYERAYSLGEKKQ